MHMQAALFFTLIFPPPPAGTKILAGFDGACARRTADAYKAFIVQAVVGHIMFADVFQNFFKTPMQQRVVFNDLVGLIPLNYIQRLARGGMLSTKPGDPYGVWSQRTAQR